MKRAALWLSVSLVVGLGLGCNKSSTPPAADAGQEQAAPQDAAQSGEQAAPQRQAVQVAEDAAPEQVVSTFLAALKAGDEATTASLLTATAREETAKHEIAVAPQSAPGATYTVSPGKVLSDNPQGAHVSSVWTETYPDGTLTYEIVWVLRHQDGLGWRIAGMAMELIPGQEHQFLNFEDPADMMRKYDEAVAAQQFAEQQAAQQQAAAQQAAAQQPVEGQQPAGGPAAIEANAAPPTQLR